MSKLYLQKAVNRKSAASAKNYISRSLRYYKNIPQNKFMNYHEQVHEIIRKNALDSNQKVSINNQYRNWLLVYFGDSVPPFNSPIKLQIAILDSAKIGDSLRFEMLKTAKRLEGVPYKYAGTTPQGGFDCSGFTQYVYHSVGIELPHNANMQSQVSSKTIPLSKLEPGDLVFFGYEHNGETKAGHAGIIFAKSENGFTVIHCVNGGVKIEGENSSWDRYWINKVLYGISMNTLANK
ncbi:MAG: C40 family peptidase [Salibacteraceae bacterium]